VEENPSKIVKPKLMAIGGVSGVFGKMDVKTASKRIFLKYVP
jgi:hypothetical protein